MCNTTFGRNLQKFSAILFGSWKNELLSIATGSTYEAVSISQVANMRCILPPIEEQKQIARFLDRETTRIDTLITKKRELIDLLQKKQDAIIYEVVTQGLNPDTSFRYGGIEWLDKIPAHWKSVRLKIIAESIQTDPFGRQLHFDDYSSGGIPVINPSHLYNGKIFADPDVAVDQKTWDRLSRHELLEGDIVFARRGELGRCGLVTSEEVGWLCGTGSMRVRLYKDWVLPAFIIQALSINGAAEQLILESVGSTMDNLNTKVLGDLLLPLPPINEQKTIVSYLQERNEYFQSLLEKTQASIDEMRHYRSSLITAAVTGKIDVCEEAKL
ncbi:MAG: restriction endonuclease subunit S [Synechococcaceae cyanobacterium SM2_3_1]|nr:restriction endonuclease subunit S [Synechococcaceae cyanobacterium SM2_3_1]